MGWLSRIFSKSHGGSGESCASQTVDAATATGRDALAQIDHLIDSGDLAAAQASLARMEPNAGHDSPAVKLRMARCERLQGRVAQARALCDELLATDCDASSIQHEIGMCCLADHHLTDAIDHFSVAVELDERNGPAWLQLGQALTRLERWDEAEHPLRSAVDRVTRELQPEAWFLLGETLRLQQRFANARIAYEACVTLDPQHLRSHIALGHVLVFLEEERDALRHYETAMSLSPHLPSTLRLNVGSIKQNLGLYGEARNIFATLVNERPGDHVARWYLSQLDLLECRWTEGWANYPARFGAQAVPYRPMPYPSWDGRPLTDETLLVLADEGLGDEIMFASCLPDLSQRVQSCIVECEPRLLALFQRSFPAFYVVATNRENSTDWLRDLPQPCWQICAGDLPRLLRADEASFPLHDGYLKADPERVTYWHRRLRDIPGEGPLVGISWRGGLVGTRTKARSIALNEWAAILRVPGVRFVNLQYGDCQSDRQALETAHSVAIYDFPEAIADYSETAALVYALDLVVTVCTAIVHLSGALGKPVWVLTPYAPGWRYTASRQSLPWYPSSRIFRQAQWNQWGDACHELSESLRAVTNFVDPE